MIHKALVFDWRAFESELAPLLCASLADADQSRLIEFANAHLGSLRDHYEGEPLADDWVKSLEVGDVQEVADHVLTKYYDPTRDGGIGAEWLRLESGLNDDQRLALLGQPFGPPTAYFDPGRMGSYFQDIETARKSLNIIRAMTDPRLSEFMAPLGDVVRSAHGVYITF